MNELIDRILLLTKAQKVGLLAGLILMIVGLDWTFFYSPQSNRIFDLEEQIKNARIPD